jgi:O-antigen/teichoic acid export membrane protein
MPITLSAFPVPHIIHLPMGLAQTMAATFASKGAAFAMTFLAGVFLSRDLGPDGKGLIDALVALAGLLLLAAPPFEEQQLFLLGHRRGAPAEFLVAGLVLAVISGGAVLLIVELVESSARQLLIYRDREAGLLRTVRVPLLRFLAAMAPLVILHRLHGGLLLGLRDLRSFNATHVLQGAVLLAVVLASVGFGLGVEGGVLAQGLALGAPGVLALLLAARHPAVRVGPFRLNWRLMADLVRGGVRVHGGVIAAYLIVSSDVLILNRHHGPEVVGIYALAAALAGQLRRLVIQPVKDVVGSEMARLTGDPPAQVALLARGTRTLILAWVPILAATLLLGYPFIVLVYRPLFADSWPLLLVLVPANLGWAVAVVLSSYLIFRNRLMLLSLLGMGVAALNIALNLLLVPGHGAWAAAWSSLACYALHAAAFCVLVRRMGGGRLRDFLAPRREDWENLKLLIPRLRRGGRSAGSAPPAPTTGVAP